MTGTDRQDEQGWWTLGVHIQAGDTLADVQARILANLRFIAESRAALPIPRSVALRLLAESGESVMAWTGYGAPPNPSFGAAAPAMPDPGPSVQTDTAVAADEPRERGYSVTVTTRWVPPRIRCSVCEGEITYGARYKAVTIGCQRFRVHDGCLARVQRQIAQALEELSAAADDEPEEDSSGND